MTSRFDQPGEKRPFCVVPVRAVKDRRLKISELRLLMALGHYANRAGVCWPSMKTLEADTGIGATDIAKMIPTLMATGMLRQLNPNDYDQKKGAWGYSNRYQILWRGDEPVPTYEEVRDANLLQPHDDRDPIEGSGARGTPVDYIDTRKHVEAFRAGVEAAAGWRPAEVAAGPAMALAEAGIDPVATRRQAEAMTRALAAERRGVPGFAEVSAVLLAGVQTSNVRESVVHAPKQGKERAKSGASAPK